ncbi:hypothetical protein SEA_GARDENSTATE_66 [Microbacterium phage GardenState]|uniref:Uncharacterized protein n=1 Tax=Microbacterium phage GardenState TaxID=2776841 RepID=A0A7L8ZDG4_9CAUD|nr:hypothetical protein SEA_GARDENSTATE_66 [Microbacterium phage GardenState]
MSEDALYDELRAAVATYQDAEYGAAANGADYDLRTEAGLRATLLPVLRERDELRERIRRIELARDAFAAAPSKLGNVVETLEDIFAALP